MPWVQPLGRGREQRERERLGGVPSSVSPRTLEKGKWCWRKSIGHWSLTWSYIAVWSLSSSATEVNSLDLLKPIFPFKNKDGITYFLDGC